MSLKPTHRPLRKLMPRENGSARDSVISAISVFLLVASPTLLDAGPERGKPKDACLIRAIETSLFSPPSPDPSGIAYIRQTDSFLIPDGEVDEMTIFAGANVFEMDQSGNLLSTFDTSAFSIEPTGVSYNPKNKHFFFSDDDAFRVYEVDPGSDGLIGTTDDVVTSFRTKAFGSRDPEDLAFDRKRGVLFLLDGGGAEVYRISPGRNKVFDGAPPDGDDEVSQFDVEQHGMTDPEGIAIGPGGKRLFIVGLPSDALLVMTSKGEFVRTIDISDAYALKPAGIAIGPAGGEDDEGKSFYIVDRGVDNDADPNEDDGKVYEISLECEDDKDEQQEGNGDEHARPEGNGDGHRQAEDNNEGKGTSENNGGENGQPGSGGSEDGKPSGNVDENPPHEGAQDE